MADLDSPPQHDEVEVSLFGPGFGECVVLHLGRNEWAVVDSCIDPADQRPVALRYLDILGVDAAHAIQRVVVTHWHDDHMRGASEILIRAEAAEFHCSVALGVEEFYTLVHVWKRAMLSNSVTDEFAQILRILEARREKAVRKAAVGPEWMIENKRIYQRVVDGVIESEMYALSPSSAAVTLAMREFGEAIEAEESTARRLIAQTPNQAAVALWVAVGDVRILLGADLENSANPKVGWQAIVGSAQRPQERARVFKVPHHGSANADEPRVWADMLERDAFALVTPYARGVRLPREEDLRRLKERTSRLFCTSRLPGGQPVALDRAVERTMREAVIWRRRVFGQMGHVRFRSRPGPQEPTVELFGAAYRV